MLTFIVCLFLVSVGTAQMYSQGMSGYGYPGAYGSQMGLGSNYMGAYSPYSSPYAQTGMSSMIPGAMGSMNNMMPGAMTGLNSMYGHSMYGNGMIPGAMSSYGTGMGSYGMSGYGSPYNRMGMGQAANKPFMPNVPQIQMPMPMQPVRSQSFAMIGGNNGGPIDPNCFH